MGIAAHWRYKEGDGGDNSLDKNYLVKTAFKWQKDARDADEFMENLKVDLYR